MSKKKKNKYGHCSEDFRPEVVCRSEDPNTSAVEVAKEIGIHPGQIYNWRRQYKRLHSVSGYCPPVEYKKMAV